MQYPVFKSQLAARLGAFVLGGEGWMELEQRGQKYSEVPLNNVAGPAGC